MKKRELGPALIASFFPSLFIFVLLGSTMLQRPLATKPAAAAIPAAFIASRPADFPILPAESVIPDAGRVSPMQIERALTAIAVPSPAIKKGSGVRLLIPRIGVDASVQKMGMTTAGAMAVPGNSTDVGWYGPGTALGATGSAVIGGHNRWGRGDGAFSRLYELEKGDTLTVVSAAGVSTVFVVRETRLFDPTDDATSIFKSASGAHLNLITCAGAWDAATQNYLKRLVVFTDEVPAA